MPGTVFSRHAVRRPRSELEHQARHLPGEVHRQDGWVETGDSGGIDLSDEALRAGLPPQEKVPKGTDAALHAQNFFHSVKSRQPTICNAEVMRKSHIACHAAAIAWMLGRTLTFDPAREVFTTPDGLDAEANRLRSRPERDCWA